MTVGTTKAALANRVFSILGSTERITSIDDDHPYAESLRTLWDGVRDEVLADHPWNFALWRQELSHEPDYDPPQSDGMPIKAWRMPNDCLRWLPYDKQDPEYFGDVVQEGEHLLSASASAPIIRYIRRVVTLRSWSPGFESSFVYRLAWHVAKPITGQSSVRDAMLAAYQESLPAAKRQDALASGDTARRVVRRGRWLAARSSGYIDG